MNLKIAIIGGSGFIGTCLIDALEKTINNQLLNIDKRSSHFHNDITVWGDIMNVSSIEKHLNGVDCVILLAAEHKDDVYPTSLYYDVNVQGTKNVLDAMDRNGIKKIIFTSSVAVYGLDKKNPNEEHPSDPFNHYGKSKWQAEEVLRAWYNTDPQNKKLDIIRPAVIFGERNRGNVYNLLKQIASGKFVMVGGGKNKKSMGYVRNIVAFIQFLTKKKTTGYNVFNFADNPDFTMNELVAHVSKVLQKNIPTTHIPLALGMLLGYGFDCFATITRRKLPISSVRVRKFCATTQIDTSKILLDGFKPPYTLSEGLQRTITYEFMHHSTKDSVTYISE